MVKTVTSNFEVKFNFRININAVKQIIKTKISMRTKRFLVCMLCSLSLVFCMYGAKKYKWEYNSKVPEVYTTAQGQQGKQIVKAWAIAGNADKAIIQAKMDAVSAALFNGIGYDASTHGMGVSNLPPLVSHKQYEENQKLFDDFFRKGDFLNYVNDVNSDYPTGENNMSVPGGRRVGINLTIDYKRLHEWLRENGIEKGIGNHFSN